MFNNWLKNYLIGFDICSCILLTVESYFFNRSNQIRGKSNSGGTA